VIDKFEQFINMHEIITILRVENYILYPKKNFLKIVAERLSKQRYDTLLLHGGCNEISNIHLSGSSTANIRSWEEKVKIPRTKMFELAQSSLKTNKNLKRVIIVKSLPIYDPNHTDPNSIKSKLNQYGNSYYDTLWMQAGCPSDISIVDQNMECQGPLKLKRFGNPGSTDHDGKPWDGIHMRGRLAARHYTNSLIRILSEFLPSGDNWSSKDNHRSCPQTRYQSHNTDNYQQSDNYQ
jgi:hypothetical protein